MNKHRKHAGWIALLALTALVLAACSGVIPETGSTEPAAQATTVVTEAATEEPVMTEEPAATEPAATGVTLEVSSSPELGEFLVDGEGMTLYLFTKDAPNVSNCEGDCLVNWPPLLVDSADQIELGQGVDASLVGTIPFEGGKQLVTYDSWPLYYWVKDMAPGDTTGQDVGGVWFVVPPTGVTGTDDSSSGMDYSDDDSSGAVTMTTGGFPVNPELEIEVEDEGSLGNFLKDGDDMTFYLFTRDEPNKTNCSGDCLVNWPPVLVPSLESIEIKEGVDASKVGVIPFEDAFLVTYDEMPLYYWINDEPGDTTGQGVGDVWFVVAP